MSDQSLEPDGAQPAGALQFDHVEPAEEAPQGDAKKALQCLTCRQPLHDEYWDFNGHPMCQGCQAALVAHFTGPIAWRTWGRVLLYGGGAALLGTLIYFAVLKISGYELGLIAIVVGLLVGGGVRRASASRGGFKLQAVAMALTYASIIAAYMPSIYQVLMEHAEKGDVSIGRWFVRGILVFLFSAAAPILAGPKNFMGWIIIGIALYEAWKLNRRVPVNVRGPLSARAAAATAAAE